MTKFSLIPKLCKVLEFNYSRYAYNGYCDKRVLPRRRLHIGKYYVAEHSKTRGLNKGDKFIIKENDAEYE